jgi:hypothetical protein
MCRKTTQKCDTFLEEKKIGGASPAPPKGRPSGPPQTPYYSCKEYNTYPTQKTLAGKTKKPTSMTDEGWEDLDGRDLSTIRLCLAYEFLFNIAREEAKTREVMVESP